jgi:hypothetical protein
VGTAYRINEIYSEDLQDFKQKKICILYGKLF